MTEAFYPPAIRRGDTQYGEGYTEKLFGRLNKLDPDFSMLFQRFVHGGLYDRDVLPHKTREFCALAALCVTGRFNQMRSHFTAARSYGATDIEIMEVIFQMSPYSGVPAVLESLQVFEDWLESGGTMTGYGK
ncbi:MAG: carboxymuconolactone decarboxylase family protein [Nitrospinae bacterium]|nr:carboxymuconolactone decarboxylase family protein [Nitrospinota bacterium]